MVHKILLIEDEVDVVKVLSKRLGAAGFEVVSSSDAIGGTQQAHRAKPNLILLDLMLPAGGGITVLKNLAQYPDTKDIPVIVITGMQDEQHKKQVMQMNIRGFIQKPYEFDSLLGEIKKILLA